MKNLYPLLLLGVLLIFLPLSNYAQSSITGLVISDEDKSPLPGVNVVVKGSTVGTVTDANGRFTINAKKGDVLIFSFIGLKSVEYSISNEKKEINMKMAIDVLQLAVSPASEWVGATLYYNIDDKTSIDNVVGAAVLRIDEVQQFKDNKYFRLLLIGNIAKIAAAKDTSNLAKNVRQITQSAQGFSVGLSPIWTINPENEHGNTFRAWSTLNYKANSIKGEGESANTLSQFRFTLGVEFEGFAFESGRKMHFGVEGALSKFSASRYEAIFGERKSQLLSAQVDVILPINKNMGFMVEGTYSKNTHPVYAAGLIFKQF